MAITRPTHGQFFLVTDLESECLPTWPENTLVWSVDTRRFRVLRGGKFFPINAPLALASSSRINQTAAIPLTTMYTVPLVSEQTLYRLSYVAKVTIPSSGSSILGGALGFQAHYTDFDDGVVITTAPGTTSNNNTVQTVVQGSIVLDARSGTTVGFSFGYTSLPGVGTHMSYTLRVSLEALGSLTAG